MRVTFNELAERELNEAAQYYELEQPGLGVAFLTDARRCTEAVVEHPDAGPIVFGAIRRRLCQRFPDALLYTAVDDELRILAVMNLRRRLPDIGSGGRDIADLASNRNDKQWGRETR